MFTIGRFFCNVHNQGYYVLCFIMFYIMFLIMFTVRVMLMATNNNDDAQHDGHHQAQC